jgi:general secretion pathway protein L
VKALPRRFVAAGHAFFRWWLAEFAGLLPLGLRDISPKTRLVLLLPEGDGGIGLRVESGRRVRVLGSLRGGDHHLLAKELFSILRSKGLSHAVRSGRIPVTVRLPAHLASRVLVELPFAARDNIDEVVAYELDRHTPFRPSQAFFAARITRLDPLHKRLEAEIIVAPRTAVEEAIDSVRGLGLNPTRVDLSDDTGAAASDELVCPEVRKPGGERQGGRDLVAWALGGTAATLAVALVWLPISDARSTADMLSRDFAAARTSAASAAVLKKQIDELIREERFLVDRKRASPGMLKLLLETTRVVPDDAWLSEWRLSDDEVRLSGSAKSASALASALEQSRFFRDTTFVSPVTRDGPDGRERFTLSARIPAGGDGGADHDVLHRTLPDGRADGSSGLGAP